MCTACGLAAVHRFPTVLFFDFKAFLKRLALYPWNWASIRRTAARLSLSASVTASWSATNAVKVTISIDGPGVYTTRILAAYLNEAGWILEEGAKVETVDQALATSVGLDAAAIDALRDTVQPFLGKRLTVLFAHAVVVGRLGGTEPTNSAGILILSHLDTVHLAGTVDGRLPLRRDGDRYYGPGHWSERIAIDELADTLMMLVGTGGALTPKPPRSAPRHARAAV